MTAVPQPTTETTIHDTAQALLAAGLCPLPAAEDGSKRPAVDWKRYQAERPDEEQVQHWFSGSRTGIGIVCGAVSGGLEMLELEGRAMQAGALPALLELVKEAGLNDLWDRVVNGYVVASPSGGLHLLYRIADAPVPPNTKLAATAANETLAETRGEGGWVVTAPSHGSVHPSGRPWVLGSGGPSSIPTITAEERADLHRLVRLLDERPVSEPAASPFQQPRMGSGAGILPGDAWAAETSWEEILEPAGWRQVFTRGAVTYWRRPGKASGISATTGYGGGDWFYPFTTSTEFEPEKTHTKFHVYAVLHHAGQHSAAAKDLKARGFGRRAEPPTPLAGRDLRVVEASAAVEPLAALAAFIEQLRGWLDLPDPGHVLLTLAAAVTRDLAGEPVWLLLVAPPSSGKTESVGLLDNLADGRLNDVTVAGLLGWSRGGKAAKPTGVLARVGARALLTFGDLSSLLSTSDRGGRDAVFGLLRRAYDGHVTRDISADGRTSTEGSLSWEGRLTVVAAVTGAIDNYSAHNDQLGPRWVYVRLPDRDTRAKRRAAALARRGGLVEHRAAARAAAAQLVTDAGRRTPHVPIPAAVEEAVEDAALVACWGRAAVPRHGYGARSIDGLPTIEEPMRLVRQLLGLARGLLALGLPEKLVIALLRRVALDSMPATRRAVLATLSLGEPLSTAALARKARLDRKVARMQAEDLQAIGVVHGQRDGDPDDEDEQDRRRVTWQLGPEEAVLIVKVFQDQRRDPRWDEMWVPTPLSPKKGEEDGEVPHTSSHPDLASDQAESDPAPETAASPFVPLSEPVVLDEATFAPVPVLAVVR